VTPGGRGLGSVAFGQQSIIEHPRPRSFGIGLVDLIFLMAGGSREPHMSCCNPGTRGMISSSALLESVSVLRFLLSLLESLPRSWRRPSSPRTSPTASG
jgi:hypothetical protein